MLDDIASPHVALGETAFYRLDLKARRVAASNQRVEDTTTDRYAHNVAWLDRIESHSRGLSRICAPRSGDEE